MRRRLSLDHLTVTDATPAALAGIAAATGCAGICPFLHSMAVLPAMPDYDLVHDRVLMEETRRAIADAGVTVDMVYPFTLTSRVKAADFEPLLDAAAALGAPLANLLCYDHDRARSIDNLAELAELASTFGVTLAIEFYPPSQIDTLAAALALAAAVRGRNVGVTVDLLHLARSNEWPACRSLLGDRAIRIAQVCDGPASLPAERLEWEAARERVLPGQGDFDVGKFVAALDPLLPVSVEVPQQMAIDLGASALERARGAVAATRHAIGEIDG